MGGIGSWPASRVLSDGYSDLSGERSVYTWRKCTFARPSSARGVERGRLMLGCRNPNQRVYRNASWLILIPAVRSDSLAAFALGEAFIGRSCGGKTWFVLRPGERGAKLECIGGMERGRSICKSGLFRDARFHTCISSPDRVFDRHRPSKSFIDHGAGKSKREGLRSPCRLTNACRQQGFKDTSAFCPFDVARCILSGLA